MSDRATDFIDVEITKNGFVGTVSSDGKILRLGPNLRLEKATLSNLNIPSVNLSHSSLANTDFTCSVLDGAYLEFCELRGTVFDRASLVSADLSNTKSEMVVFLGADLSRTKMVDSDLRYAKMDGSNCFEADFSGSNMRDVSCRATDFRKADLTNVDISGGDFSGAYWAGAKTFNMVIRLGSDTVYEKYKFGEARDRLAVADQRFEFLVSSKALEVRDNDTLQVVSSGFDIEKHHIPVWALKNMEIVLKDQR